MITNDISQEIWKDRYRKNGETYYANLKRVAEYLATDSVEEEKFFDVMEQGLFFPAGRTMSNAGIGKSLTLNNCYTLNLVPDDMESIFEYVKYGALTQKAGGGTGYNFSLLRPNGTPTSNDAVASGVVSFMNAFDSQTHTVMQGSRRGANLGCLLIYHPDILEFLESKSWDEEKLVHFNLSVLVDDKFMNAVKDNEDIILRYPCMDEKGTIIEDESKWLITKKINASYLWDLIIKKAYDTGEYGVLFYDNLNNDNNLKYMETIVTTNPCAEYISGVVKVGDEVKYDYFGACNLGSLFLHNFVKEAFTTNAHIDFQKLKETIRVAVNMLDNVIDINNYPLRQYENYQKNIRTIGLGITGLADMLVMMGMKYGSEKSVKFTNSLMDFIVFNAYEASCDLAEIKGAFPLLNKEEFIKSEFIQKHLKDNKEWQTIINKILYKGIRNGRMISIAPCGTISMAYGNNCSSGLEPIFSLEYDRKVKIGGQEEENMKIVKMRDYAYQQWLNTSNNTVSKNKFVTAMDLGVDEHLNILKTVAYHADMSCSKTINIPEDYSFEKTKKVYTKCWEYGIKGVTIFRPNKLRQGILISSENKKEESEETYKELKRGEWEQKPDDILYIERKAYTGCGKLLMFIGVSKAKNKIFDVYFKKSGVGGCTSNTESNAILMSTVLRTGGSLENIECAFRGLTPCNSFVQARAKGKQLSKGSSCPTVMLNVLKELENELKNHTLKEFVELGIYDDSLKLNKVVTKEHKINLETTCKGEVAITKDNVFSEEEYQFIAENGESSYSLKFNKCPQCNETLENSGGCKICISCGWSKCD